MLTIKRGEDGTDVSVFIDGADLEVVDVGDNHILAECDLNQVAAVPMSEVIEPLVLHMHESSGFGTYLFYEVEVCSKTGAPTVEFICHQPNKFWEGRWGLATFLSAVRDQTTHFDGVAVGEIELEDDWKRLTVVAKATDATIGENIARVARELKKIIAEAEIALGGIQWKKSFEVDEKEFCIELLLPLLRRMGFIQVRYTHGKKEYGKDFTFSEMSPFSDMRHYGLQAKAGDLSGEAGSLIDTILGQVNDAFAMPYHELGSKDDRYISTFILAVSGKFTENAREKIANKINKGLMGSVYFLDRERIVELIDRYWRK